MAPESVGMLPAGPPPPEMEVAVAVGGTPVAVAVGIPAGVFVTVGVEDGVNVDVAVGGVVGVNEGVSVGPPGVMVAVGVDVGGGVVGVGLGVKVGVNVGPPGVMVGVTVGVGVGVSVTPNAMHFENSDVLLLGSVAVAVMTDPAETVTGSVTLNVAMQDAFVEGVATPRNVIPSPKSLGGPALQEGLEKNSIR